MKNKKIYKVYVNKYGVKIEAVEENTDITGTKYITWKFSDSDTHYNLSADNFNMLIKLNKYKEVK